MTKLYAEIAKMEAQDDGKWSKTSPSKQQGSGLFGRGLPLPNRSALTHLSTCPHIGHFFKQAVKVFRRVCRDLLQCLIPQFGNMFGGMTHKSRLVLPAAFGNGC